MKKFNLLDLKSPSLSRIIVAATKDQVYRDLDGETIILNLETGIYSGLNAIGARIWKLLQEPTSIKAIRDTLLKEYAVECDQCECELLTYLQDLSDNGFIEVNIETAT